MNLELLGFNDWFGEHANDLLQLGQQIARVIAVDRDAFVIRGEGTHTTSRRQLLLLESGAMLIDTPGMRELGLLGASDGLDDSFTDISELAQNCRFADCTHSQEPGCAVVAAIENNELDAARYESYLKLKRENEYYDMSYVDKRKKDKAFGKHIKNVMKHKAR